MKTVRTVADLRAVLAPARREGASIGLVPTMGALHEGHLSLIRRARADTDVVVVSLFVNPTQFAPTEDLAAYPRDEAGDARAAEEAGADVLFAPSVEAALTMIANITTTPTDIPETTSTRISLSCRASTRPIRCALRSSTSSPACQTNRYGEIVVPKIAISASTEASVGWKLGTRPAATEDQLTSTTSSSTT